MKMIQSNKLIKWIDLLLSTPHASVLKLQCCFCNYDIDRDTEIRIGKMHQCSSCDSEIEALTPTTGTQCGIGRWRSKIS